MLKPDEVLFEVISGPEGPCLSIGNGRSGYRLAGPKPWGGGCTVHVFTVNVAELLREIQTIAPPVAPTTPEEAPLDFDEVCQCGHRFGVHVGLTACAVHESDEATSRAECRCTRYIAAEEAADD